MIKRVSVRAIGAIMVGVMGLTLVSVAPAAATTPATPAVEEACVGGAPGYWLENPWPKFTVPKSFQNPNKKNPTNVRPWTKFNQVFRWRNGKDQEGKILPYSLRSALKNKTPLLKGAARQTVAALLNAAEPNNSFPWSKHNVIKTFQVHWDGTEDMSPKTGRKYLKAKMRELNALACPVVESP